MAYVNRSCGGAGLFNSGKSRCPVPHGKLKGAILVDGDLTLPANITAEAIEVAAHADRPNRIYPIKLFEEYAQTGGEAQTAQQGYGANRVSDYSALTMTVTMDSYDAGLKANIVRAKNMPFSLYLINDSNIIFGIRGNDGQLHGIPLSGMSVGGQEFDSSGQVAFMTINFMFKDIEAYWKTQMVREVDFDIVQALNGLVDVEFVPVEGQTGQYLLLETIQGLNLTPNYGQLIADEALTVLPGATAVTYANGVISATGSMQLAKPSVLQANGIIGIEQSGTIAAASAASGGGGAIDPNA